MSVAKKLIDAVAKGRAKVEMFYDNGIVEPGMKGTHIVIGGTALFASVTAMVGSSHEMAEYLHYSGDLATVGKEMISKALIGGSAWVALITATAAVSNVEMEMKRDGQHMPPIPPIKPR